MTTEARKRAVRTRMTKTGESYTAARRQVIGEARRTASDGEPNAHADLAVNSGPAVHPDPALALPPRAAEPEVSDAALLRATGRA